MRRHAIRLPFWCAIGLLVLSVSAWAAAPLLYRQADYESPVRGDPDDLLLIPGYGFTASDRVVYQAMGAAAGESAHPASIPTQSNATVGTADVVSTANIPYSLTIRLPAVMRPGQVYSLWVATARGEWSEPAMINDARPLWLSPPYVYANAALASLPRSLKVVGRNLEPVDGATTQVRLSGPVSLVLDAAAESTDLSDLTRYVALVPLPAQLPTGWYRVQVKRDPTGWVELLGQALEVRPDPPPQQEFHVGSGAFGECKADETADDTPCVRRAIAAAEAAGGGTVVFGSGTWHLAAASVPDANGIVVPRGVNLRGAGSVATTLVQDADPDLPAARATFTLLGGNVVRGFTFRDAHVFSTARLTSTFLKLGLNRGESEAAAGPAAAIEDVIITQNVFDRPLVAISDGGAPIRRLFITYNEFGAYRIGLQLSGSRPLVNDRFGIDDAVIAHNIFKPGSYLDTSIVQGTMASELGASQRVDFSSNIADGTTTDRLNSSDAPRGWRAAFFWHMDSNEERLLVSQNVASCTGDKDGDGEAISYDGNANTFALPSPRTVIDADANVVKIMGPLAMRQNERDIRIPDYYQGHWIQIVEGPGLGQVRKISAYSEDRGTGVVILSVEPAWDVVPAPGQTRIAIGREYWQVYTVANTVDQRKPPCMKSNRTSHKGGDIGFWAQLADSAIEGNRQYDTDGISFRLHYNAEQAACGVCNRETSYVDFLEIRDNLIDGEYDWSDDCSSSGIRGSLAAAPTDQFPPPTVGYGISISHNTVRGADGWRGGAISLTPTWFAGPPPFRWALADSSLIDHNSLLGLDASPAVSCKADKPHARTGISLGSSELVRRSVLYANSCPQARRPLFEVANDTTVICEANVASCGCPSP